MPNFSSLAPLKVPEKFVWGVGRGWVVCTVIFISNPTFVLCCVEVGVLTIADPKFVSWIGWRDSIVTFVRTHSKVTISMLTCIGAHPIYNQIQLSKMKPQFSSIHDYDIITTFDNEQKLKKSYRLGGEEGSNKISWAELYQA